LLSSHSKFAFFIEIVYHKFYKIAILLYVEFDFFSFHLKRDGTRKFLDN